MGSGGREHALGWKLAQSPKVDQVYFAPGNGGTQNNVNITVDDIEGLAKFAQEKKCITVGVHEDPPSNGICNDL